MADISLKPISQLPVYNLVADADYDDIYLVVSLPDSFNPGQYVSRKTAINSFISRVKADSTDDIQEDIDSSIQEFYRTLSGTVSNALTSSLPAASIVITNENSKLSTSSIKLSELNMLSGCVANIKATFDLLQLSTSLLSTDLNAKYTQLTAQTTNLTTKVTNLSTNTLPTVSATLSSAIVSTKNILSSKLDTLSIDVDIIKRSYVDKDDNAQELDQLSTYLSVQLSTNILNVVAEVSAALSSAIEQIKTDYIGKFNEVASIADTNAKNIQFILDNLDIGVNMFEVVLSNGQWTSREIKDKYGNSSVGYMFKIDDPKYDDVNEAVLLIGAGTPTENELSAVEMSSFNADGKHSINGNVNDLLRCNVSSTIDLEVDTNIASDSTTIKLNGNQQNIKFEQFVFLNIN